MDDPSRPGLMKSKIDQRSPSRFSIGVPVSAMRASARSCLTVLVCLAPGFLIACASSSIASRHARRRQPRHAGEKAVAGDDEIDIGQVGGGLRPSAVSAGIADGWTTTAFRLGANRAISAAQLASSEAGATSSDGLRLPPACSLQHQQQRQDLDGLAEPHVVGEAGAKSEPGQQMQPAARPPADRAAASPAATGRDRRARPVRWRKRRQRLAPARDRPRSGSSRRRLGRQPRPRKSPAPASRRMASPNDRPSAAARRSIASN